jgi:membrane associated rhomboid family serine protease
MYLSWKRITIYSILIISLILSTLLAIFPDTFTSFLLPNTNNLFLTLLLHPFIHVYLWELVLNVLILYLSAKYLLTNIKWWEFIFLWLLASFGGGFAAIQWSFNLHNWGGLTLFSCAILAWAIISNNGIYLRLKSRKINLGTISNIFLLLYIIIILFANMDLLLSAIVVSIVSAILGFITTRFSKRISHKKNILHEKPPINDYDYYDKRKELENEMNRILEKIKKKGESSLSKDEKDFIDEYAKKFMK